MDILLMIIILLFSLPMLSQIYLDIPNRKLTKLHRKTNDVYTFTKYPFSVKLFFCVSSIVEMDSDKFWRKNKVRIFLVLQLYRRQFIFSPTEFNSNLQSYTGCPKKASSGSPKTTAVYPNQYKKKNSKGYLILAYLL